MRGISASPGGGLAPLEGALAARHGAHRAFLLSSGRAALAIGFDALARADAAASAESAPVRREVLVPGYTCPSVVAAAARVGLLARPVDIVPGTLDYDRGALDRVESQRVLALVSGNLFGIPNDLPFLESFAEERGIALVDDAAQALDARIGDRRAGGFGRLGVLSLERGKNLTTVSGGVLLCHDARLLPHLEAAVGAVPLPPSRRTLVQMAQLLLYALFLHPRLYPIPDHLLPLGVTTCDPGFPLYRFPPRLVPMASLLLGRIDELTAGRRERAEWIRAGLGDGGGEPWVDLPGHGHREGGADPVYPRFPLLMGDRQARDEALSRLRGAGLGGSGFYPSALLDFPPAWPYLVPDAADTPGARTVADRVLTLPTHGFVTRDDVAAMIRILREVREGCVEP